MVYDFCPPHIFILVLGGIMVNIIAGRHKHASIPDDAKLCAIPDWDTKDFPYAFTDTHDLWNALYKELRERMYDGDVNDIANMRWQVDQYVGYNLLIGPNVKYLIDTQGTPVDLQYSPDIYMPYVSDFGASLRYWMEHPDLCLSGTRRENFTIETVTNIVHDSGYKWVWEVDQ